MKIKQFCRENLPFIAVGIVALLWHLVLKISAGDDVVYFQTLMDGRSIFEILAHRYATWSSRLAIEFVLIPLVQCPPLWKILDIIIYTSIPVLLYRLLWREGQALKMKWLVCGFVLLYPFSDMVSAGWIATTTNYLWPLWCLLYLCLLLKRMALGGGIRWYQAVAGILACIYGSSQEQVAAILLVILVLAVIYFRQRKQAGSPLLFVFAAIDIASLAVILLCPGNAVRSMQEAGGRMPEFVNFSVWEKVYMGVANVERIFIAGVNSIFLIVAVTLAVLVYVRTKDYRKTLISGVPVLVLAGYALIRTGHPWYEKIFIIPEQTAKWDFTAAETYLPILFLLAAAGGIAYALFVLLGERPAVYLDTLFLLAAGLASGVVMGFSPTIYASAGRPYIYLYFILSGVCLYCLDRSGTQVCREVSPVLRRLAATGLFLFVLVNVAEVLWMCHIM